MTPRLRGLCRVVELVKVSYLAPELLGSVAAWPVWIELLGS